MRGHFDDQSTKANRLRFHAYEQLYSSCLYFALCGKHVYSPGTMLDYLIQHNLTTFNIRTNSRLEKMLKSSLAALLRSPNLNMRVVKLGEELFT